MGCHAEPGDVAPRSRDARRGDATSTPRRAAASGWAAPSCSRATRRGPATRAGRAKRPPHRCGRDGHGARPRRPRVPLARARRADVTFAAPRRSRMGPGVHAFRSGSPGPSSFRRPSWFVSRRAHGRDRCRHGDRVRAGQSRPGARAAPTPRRARSESFPLA
ncbi:hypothetical protein DB32_005925 [Sandaracinus amylolyticus]|uniref:Uncharacterized protein n=1 Tax=Sandaracinus amylolyticus TaxID=927083 RepID=A0A0F6YL09_9BACT|nr:hypothetical protein DB32_005925 [Sandaracinus amylolyticus]